MDGNTHNYIYIYIYKKLFPRLAMVSKIFF